MMNWRMLGLNIGNYTSPLIGEAIIFLGSLATVLITFFVLRKQMSQNSVEMVFALLGVTAATCIVSWHSHQHMSIVLVLPMIYLLIRGWIKNEIILYMDIHTNND